MVQLLIESKSDDSPRIGTFLLCMRDGEVATRHYDDRVGREAQKYDHLISELAYSGVHEIHLLWLRRLLGIKSH